MRAVIVTDFVISLSVFNCIHCIRFGAATQLRSPGRPVAGEGHRLKSWPVAFVKAECEEGAGIGLSGRGMELWRQPQAVGYSLTSVLPGARSSQYQERPLSARR